jgi:hypothetical protein
VEYLAHSPVGESRAVVEFTGSFEGHPVLWQATIVALNAASSSPVDQYITVDLELDAAPRVEIGLPVAIVSEPTILKAITMLRHYKNLRRGRHEFQGIRKQE